MSRSLRVLLFAHQQLGVSALEGLLAAGHQVQACFTHAVTEAWMPSVMQACASAKVACTDAPLDAGQSQKFRDARPDLIVSAGFRRRIPLPFLALPRWGSINAHL